MATKWTITQQRDGLAETANTSQNSSATSEPVQVLASCGGFRPNFTQWPNCVITREQDVLVEANTAKEEAASHLYTNGTAHRFEP